MSPAAKGTKELKSLECGKTKIQGDIKNLVKDLWANRGVRFCQLEASGTRGGVLILWDEKVWTGEVSSLGAYSLTCKFTGKNRDFTWCLTGIYAPNNRVEREEVWWELGSARGLFDGPWVVCGDFNTARFPSEKRNCSRFTRTMYDLSDFIEDMSLQDPHLIGANTLGGKGRDMMLLPGLIEGLMDRVKMWWDSIFYEGRPDFILAFKLRALKDKLKEWTKTSYGNLAMQKQSMLAKLAELEEIQDQRALTEDETLSKAELFVDFENIATCDEIV
ncbi:hypothetical protein MTR67_031250 [Solanum verrucosum]|uniref:Endonuclease/exonuclease/phosphatase domain-containing protein n=1 Tax=Solanum verrucosum TaxID=315347 RepID=A0AAF0ZFS6_SOLVR|nr:hypothetical protein MTR67_031250 [Solanum verrucosum]